MIKLICKFLIVTLCALFQIKAQQYSNKQIDSLADYTFKLLGSNTVGALKNGKLIWNLSQTNDYNGGKAQALSIFATTHLRRGETEKGIQYCNKLEKFAFKTKEYLWLCDALRLKAMAYSRLGLYEEAQKDIHKAFEYAEKIKSEYEYHKIKGIIYEAEAALFADKNSGDTGFKLSLKNHYKTLEEYLKSPRIKSKNPELITITYNNIALRHMQLKEYDKAKVTLDKALNFNPSKQQKYEKGETLNYLGTLYRLQNENKKAIEYLNEAYEQNRTSANDPYIRNDIFNELYLSYKGIDEMKSQEYLEKHQLLSDSLSSAEKQSLKIPVQEIIDEKDEEFNSKKKQLYYLLVGLIFLSGVIMFFGIRSLKKYRKEKAEKLQIKETVIQKETMIEEKDSQLTELEQKINEAFNEVIALAKKDDPSFLARFKEVYPDFYNKLSSADPQMTAGQLKFCALLKLNFSTKEIAQHTNISVRSVEMKKNRLRKQLNIPSDVDLNKFMIEL
ncbi:hypothetical protein CHRYSEOSP005_24290 [Chryseobacterium sp. Alg-005]|uniref:tetratricopeptide repeat protein n=1 Tax=Chryseobacterium sp. Alg-005 TaxID=3159516 RepID=UPI003555BD2A